jgi:hypothetical protein
VKIPAAQAESNNYDVIIFERFCRRDAAKLYHYLRITLRGFIVLFQKK